MQNNPNKLETYITNLKEAGAQLPSRVHLAQPNLTKISVASGVDLKVLKTPEGRRQINLAVQEIGLDAKFTTAKIRQKRYEEENANLVSNYLGWLEERGIKLPEDPTHRGEVFLKQLKVEAGLPHESLGPRRLKEKGSSDNELMKMIESAVPRLGLAVRVLTSHAGEPGEALTYKTLLEKGTEERRRELQGKPNARQQLYNTRSKLKLFCKTTGIDLIDQVGDEFAVEFEETVNKVLSRIKSVSSRKKFHTEIRRWSDYYQRIIKTDSLPEDFNEAFRRLVDSSGLISTVLGKLIGTNAGTVRSWYDGRRTPRSESLTPVSRMEALFKLQAGALVSKLPQLNQRRRIIRSRLPEFLRDDSLMNRACRHLPADFLELSPEMQRQVFESIQDNVLRSNSPYGKRQAELTRLPYLLKKWPAAAAEEFELLSSFKTGDRPPLRMRRIGQWSVSTVEMARDEFAAFFGALRLPTDAEDVRVRGLGVPDDNLTMALVASPLIVDWYIRFRGARTQYTTHTIKLLKNFMSLLKEGTGWIRQMPYLADRLRPVSDDQAALVSTELIHRARTDWDGVCKEAFEHYIYLCHELKPLVCVGRNPFHPIEGIVQMDDPNDAFELLLKGMRGELPNRNTQPVFYHTAVRDCALVALIAATGFRATTIGNLDYTGDKSGHLMLRDDSIILEVPRGFFKNPNSSYFGPARSKMDYSNVIPNVFWLVDIFKEYLNVSRPFLLSTFHPGSEVRPLFVSTAKGGNARCGNVRASARTVSAIYRRMTERHLAENKWRGTGISQVCPSGVHSARHIRGTATIKQTGSFQLAGDANQHSASTAAKHYARFATKDRNRRVNDILFSNRIK